MKEMKREVFGDLLINSLYNIEKTNKELEKLGVTIKPYINYEYYYKDDFICTSDNFCLDDILDSLNIKVVD